MIHWSNELKKIKEQIEQNEQEFEGVAKKGLANTFTAKNTFREDIELLQDKKLKMGWENNDIKLEFGAEFETKNAIINAPQGDLKISCKDGNTINMSNRRISNVANPTNGTDALNRQTGDTRYLNRETNATGNLDITNTNNQSANIRFVKQATGTGYRNWNSLGLYWKNSDVSGYETPHPIIKFTMKSADTPSPTGGKGIFVKCESNRWIFEEETKMQNIAAPVNANDAVNKAYVDGLLTPLLQEIETLKSRIK